jgi:RNA polymerase sigma-70 factor (TIGR02960 family)
VTTVDLISRARAGDGAAFDELTQPYRRELQVHCYRMLGSLEDAEDALQDTLLAAWRGLGAFEGRASLRTWLYQVATRRCLDARRAAARRPAKAWDVPHVQPPEPTRLGEVVWLQPYPDALLDGLPATPPGPEARYELAESVSLAFVTACQVLPPRQLAVLVLRDVLGFPAAEVAAMLGISVDAANSALKRARAGLQRSRGAEPSVGSRAEGAVVGAAGALAKAEVAAAAGAPVEAGVVARFVRAWEAADVAGLVDLLTDDVFMSMPPMPFEYHGRDAVARFSAALFAADRRFDLVPTRANGQPAFGAYLRAPTGLRHGVGLYVLGLRAERISALTRFESSVLPRFGLPRSLPMR